MHSTCLFLLAITSTSFSIHMVYMEPRGKHIYDNETMAIPWPYDWYSNGHWPMSGQWEWTLTRPIMKVKS